jgi:hypothetical protein
LSTCGLSVWGVGCGMRWSTRERGGGSGSTRRRSGRGGRHVPKDVLVWAHSSGSSLSVRIARCTDSMAKGGGDTTVGRAGLGKEWWGGLKGSAKVGHLQGRMPGRGGGLSRRSRWGIAHRRGANKRRRGLVVKQGCSLTRGPRLAVSERERERGVASAWAIWQTGVNGPAGAGFMGPAR